MFTENLCRRKSTLAGVNEVVRMRDASTQTAVRVKSSYRVHLHSCFACNRHSARQRRPVHCRSRCTADLTQDFSGVKTCRKQTYQGPSIVQLYDVRLRVARLRVSVADVYCGRHRDRFLAHTVHIIDEAPQPRTKLFRQLLTVNSLEVPHGDAARSAKSLPT